MHNKQPHPHVSPSIRMAKNVRMAKSIRMAKNARMAKKQSSMQQQCCCPSVRMAAPPSAWLPVRMAPRPHGPSVRMAP